MTIDYAYKLLHSQAAGFTFYDETGAQWGPYATGEQAVRMLDEIRDRFHDASLPHEVEFPRGEFPY